MKTKSRYYDTSSQGIDGHEKLFYILTTWPMFIFQEFLIAQWVKTVFVAHYGTTSIPINAWKQKVGKGNSLPCWPPRGQQVLRQMWFCGIHRTHARGSTLALKPRADVTRSSKQGISDYTKRLMSSKLKKEEVYLPWEPVYSPSVGLSWPPQHPWIETVRKLIDEPTFSHKTTIIKYLITVHLTSRLYYPNSSHQFSPTRKNTPMNIENKYLA